MTLTTKSRAASKGPREDLPSRRPPSSDLRPVHDGHSWLTHGRNWSWAGLIVGVLVSLESFFVRQLVSALLLFTVVFVIAAVLIAVFIGISYATDSAISWTGSQVRSIHFFMHDSGVLPARYWTGRPDGIAPRFKGLDRN